MSVADLRSVPELLNEALQQASTLFQNEASLVRAELSDKASQAARGAVMIGVGAVLMIPALVMILFAIAAAIVTAGVEPWLAYLVTGVGALVIAGLVMIVGKSRLSADKLKPRLAIEEFRRDQSALKEMAR